MELSGTSLLGSRRASARGGEFRAVNPATGMEIEPEFFSATADDVDRAATLAAKAFAVYGRLPAARRAGLLRTIAAKLEAAGCELVDRAHLETGLRIPRLQSELGRTCFQLRLMADIVSEGSWVDARIDRADPQRKPLPKPDVRSMLRPLGPVAVFGASNFPLAFSVAGGDTASALAAGSPVIVKAHPAHPGTSELAGLAVQSAVRESGLPDGVFSLLFDSGTEIGGLLVGHPLVRAVGFTGSRRGGRALLDIAAARPEPIPVYAEMGSINPVFVTVEAMSERGPEIAAGVHQSVSLGVGQFCTNPGLVVVERGDATEGFLEKLAALVRTTVPEPMLTPSICRNYRRGVDHFAGIAGVERLAWADAEAGVCGGSAALFSTSARTFLSDDRLLEEVFGPSTLVVECGDPEEMLAVARRLEGQLTATVHASAAEIAGKSELLQVLETKAGRILFNGYPTGVEVCHAMVHGGPYPASSDGRSTSVGGRAIARFARLVSYQGMPDVVLPDELRESNPLGIWRLIDGALAR